MGYPSVTVTTYEDFFLLWLIQDGSLAICPDPAEKGYFSIDSKCPEARDAIGEGKELWEVEKKILLDVLESITDY